MKDRIKQIIEHENITYSKFADILGIQRSGISHILNGRNNPSLEVVQKILESFKDINTDWLLLGKGEMFSSRKREGQQNLFDKKEEPVKTNPTSIKSPTEIISISEENTNTEPTINKPEDSQEDNKKNKKTERIIIFFNDHSFKEYIPEK